MKLFISSIGIIFFLSILTSCSESGGDLPPIAPSATFNGTVTDAVISGATLRIYQFDGGIQGALIGETITDNNGDFELDNFTSTDRPIVIEATGGRYTEEASGVSVSLIQGQMLRAYMFYEQGSKITLQVTPFTHLATCLADSKIRAGVNVNNAITESTSVFSGIVGVDILGTRPFDITDPNNANFEVTDNLRYGAVLAAISSFTAEVSETNGVTPHRFNQNSSIYATQVLCQDIAADGIFNGTGFVNNGTSIGQLSLGSVPLSVDTLRTQIAQHILSIMSSDRNATNLTVNDFVLYANEIASSTDGVFGGVPAQAVDNVGPTVTAVLAPDSFLKDIVNLSFIIEDPIGVKSVEFNVNDTFHSSGQVINPVMSLNSTNYTDGVIKITVIATDILNNESAINFNYIVDNTSPTVALTSSTLVNNRAYTATGTYQEEGAAVASIQVNGVDAAIDTDLQTWSVDVNLLSGENIVTIDITDIAANSSNVNFNVNVDLIKPIIVPNITQADFTTFQGQLNLCNTGQLNQTSGNTNPVCLSTDNVSLLGTQLSGALQSQGYVLFGYSPTDPQGAGVFTSQEEIIVEYKYELNNVEVISWTAAPIASSNLFYYFPMVTEYLGINWFQTTTDDIHKVTFRVTDNAGNSSELFFEIRFDVLVPEIAVNTVIDNSLFAATSFANRTGIDGQAINVYYTFDNVNNAPILFSVNDAQAHEVKHTYETGIRENQARLVTTRNWQFRFSRPDNSGTGWMQPSFVYNGLGQPLATSVPLYGLYQSFLTDNPTPPTNGAWAAKLMSEMCAYSPAVQQWHGTNVYSTFHEHPSVSTVRALTPGFFFPVVDYAAAVVLKQFAPPSTCIDSALPGISQSWQERTTFSYQNSTGFPRNNINDVVINNSVNTESLTVTNTTLGQIVLPINGWYSVPAGHSISINKRARMPVLTHFFDNELANVATFSSYAEKKLDKTTTWKIDTDLVFSHVIDPGDIHNVNSVTPTVSNVGNGIFTKTISR